MSPKAAGKYTEAPRHMAFLPASESITRALESHSFLYFSKLLQPQMPVSACTLNNRAVFYLSCLFSMGFPSLSFQALILLVKRVIDIRILHSVLVMLPLKWHKAHFCVAKKQLVYTRTPALLHLQTLELHIYSY